MSYVGLKKYRNQAIIKEGFGTNDIGYINICKDVASLNYVFNFTRTRSTNNSYSYTFPNIFYIKNNFWVS